MKLTSGHLEVIWMLIDMGIQNPILSPVFLNIFFFKIFSLNLFPPPHEEACCKSCLVSVRAAHPKKRQVALIMMALVTFKLPFLG